MPHLCHVENYMTVAVYLCHYHIRVYAMVDMFKVDVFDGPNYEGGLIKISHILFHTSLLEHDDFKIAVKLLLTQKSTMLNSFQNYAEKMRSIQ